MVRLDDSVMIAATEEYVVTIALVLIIGYWLFVICYLCICVFMYLFCCRNFYFEMHKALNFLFKLQQKLKVKIKFFGTTHDHFWPCSNGLISFKGRVRAGGVLEGGQTGTLVNIK